MNRRVIGAAWVLLAASLVLLGGFLPAALLAADAPSSKYSEESTVTEAAQSQPPQSLPTDASTPPDPAGAFARFFEETNPVLLSLGALLILALITNIVDRVLDARRARGSAADRRAPGVDDAERDRALKEALTRGSKGHPSQFEAADDDLVDSPHTLSDIAITDAALTSSTQDLLGTRRLARGLSLFLRNDKTQPPLTLAITGTWGSGKSSVMGMLKDELRNAGKRTVWFNAWHHHQEGQLFGALLETIRQDAIPPIWRYSGVAFRANLIGRRLRRRLPLLVFTVITLIAALLNWSQLVGHLTGISGALDKSFTDLTPADFGLGAGALGGLVVLGGIATRLFTSFGMRPGKLTKRLGRAVEAVGVRADPGLRYRISVALDDVTCALGDNTLVIFIDDLDRCPPDHILSVLEAINFLTAIERKCYIVLGMAVDKLLPALSTHFARVVDEGYEETGDSAERETILKEKRKKYARHYLEKMINVEVHVPNPPADTMHRLAQLEATDSEPESEGPDEAGQRWIAKLVEYGTVYVAFAAAVALLIFWPAGPEVPAAGDGGVGTVTSSGSAVPEATSTYPWVPPLAGAAAGIAAIGLFANSLSRRITENRAVDDAPEFAEALRIWTPCLTASDGTPRHFKRTVNQLRFLDMRARAESSEDEPGDHAIDFVVLRALREVSMDAPAQLQGNLPAADQTALKAMETARHSADDYGELVREALVEHRAVFGENRWPTAEARGLFEQLVGGVTLR